MTVNTVYSIIQYIANKFQAGDITPDQFNLIINEAQVSFLDYLLGEFQQYQYGRPQARVEFGQNSVVRQRLTPLIYGVNLNIDNTGFSPYPNDYQQTDAMWGIYGYNKIRYAQQNSLSSYVNSHIDPIATNPIYLIEQNGFRFFPNNLGAAKLNYVGTPAQIVWASSPDIYGRPVYNPNLSVDPVWYDTDILDIISRALRMVGVNLQDQAISQYAERIIKEGQ